MTGKHFDGFYNYNPYFGYYIWTPWAHKYNVLLISQVLNLLKCHDSLS